MGITNELPERSGHRASSTVFSTQGQHLPLLQHLLVLSKFQSPRHPASPYRAVWTAECTSLAASRSLMVFCRMQQARLKRYGEPHTLLYLQKHEWILRKALTQRSPLQVAVDFSATWYARIFLASCRISACQGDLSSIPGQC